jgi:gas vesicle protein
MANSVAYLSAVAALVGTFVGGVTSIATSWLGQQRQTKEQRRAHEKEKLQALYKQFIQDASKLYVDALEHNTTESRSWSMFTPRSTGCVYCHHQKSSPRQTKHCG